jgi:hypothetical protein
MLDNLSSRKKLMLYTKAKEGEVWAHLALIAKVSNNSFRDYIAFVDAQLEAVENGEITMRVAYSKLGTTRHTLYKYQAVKAKADSRIYNALQKEHKANSAFEAWNQHTRNKHA